MRGIKRGLAVLVLVSIVGVARTTPIKKPVTAYTTAQGSVQIKKDVEYGLVEGEHLTLDLFVPTEPAEQKHPGIVFVHGGGWSGGDKKDFDAQAEEVARRGYVAITVNHRFAPKYRFPAAIEDVQRAVRWLRSHAEEFHLDPNRVGSMGASSGGHLASMLGVRDTWNPESAKGEPSSRVNCVVDYYGRMDLNLPQGGHDYRQAFTGKSGAEAVPVYREASPITYVDSHTVPFLIVQGYRDPQVGKEQSENMLQALDKTGIEASLLMLAGQGHGFGGNPGRLAWQASLAFFDAHLMPNKQ